MDSLEEDMTEMRILDNKAFASSRYIKFGAHDKMKYLWSAIKSTTRPGSFPSMLETAKIFIGDMKRVMDWPGDAMKTGTKKLIHSVGATGKVKFVPNKHPFSGMFKTEM